MGEFETIEAIRSLLGVPPERVAVGIGDDAAVTRAGEFAVTSVDAIVDSVHFDRQSWPAQAIGWKAAATAISDLAAMAAKPSDLLVAAGLPDGITDDELTELFSGVAAAAESFGMTVIGGDTVNSPMLWLSVTVVGYLPTAQQAMTRSGGNTGDLLAVTGSLGGARAGLALMQDSQLAAAAGLNENEIELLINRQQRPVPLIAAAQALRSAGAKAMIDLSDGLTGDLAHLAGASECGAEVELARIPVGESTARVARALGDDPTEFAATGGEDYELLVALPAKEIETAQAAAIANGTALTPIGKLVPTGPVRITRPDGTAAKLKSFEHLT